MSHEGGSERTQQRTVAELLAKYGDSSAEGAPRRRRRRADDVSDTAPQAIIDRVLSDSGEMAAIREDQEPPERTSHRQTRAGRRAAPPPPVADAPPARHGSRPEPQEGRAPRHDPPEPMTEQLPRVPPSARRRRPAEPDAPARQTEPPARLPHDGPSRQGESSARLPEGLSRQPHDARQGESSARLPHDGPGRQGESSARLPEGLSRQPHDGQQGESSARMPEGLSRKPHDGPGRQGGLPDGAPRQPHDGGRPEPEGPRQHPPERSGPPRRIAAALEGTQRGIPALDDDPGDQPPVNGRNPSLPRRAPGGSRMPQRAPKPIPPQNSQALPKPKQPSQPLPAPPPGQQPSHQLPKPQNSQPLPMPPGQPFPAPQPSQALPVNGMPPPSAQTTEVGRPIRPGDFPGDASQTEVDPQAPPPEFLEEHEAFDDKAARRFDGYTAHDDLESPDAEAELDEFDDIDDLDEEAEPEEEVSPAKAWLTMVGQLALGVVGGAAVWLGFNWLWGFMPVAALVAAVLVIAGLVFIVRKIRRADDLNTTVLAVLVGLVVTVSPAMLLLVGR